MDAGTLVAVDVDPEAVDRVAPGPLADAPVGRRVEAEAFDRQLELPLADGRTRVEPLGRLRQRARRSHDPAGPEVLPDVHSRTSLQMNDR